MTKTLIDFPIHNRWTGEVQFIAKIECDPTDPNGFKIGLAVKWALQNRANLTRANLTDADLTDANLTDADLTGADLTGANLTDANLTGANLTRANLTDADLTGADLTGANLTRANLTRADLTRANLTDANLTGETLRPFKADLWLTLSELETGPLEALHLIQKLERGEVDGSTYGEKGNPCACLVGTIAQARSVDGTDLDHNNNRPAERWFMMIHPGDKPENETGGGFAARQALIWVRDWLAAQRRFEKGEE